MDSISGIYEIVNRENGKRYIGSAVHLERRKTEHFGNLRKGKHRNRHLQSAYAKYGENSFVFSVLEYCGKERLIEREQFYIDVLCPEYNIAPRAGSNFGIRFSAEVRAKISASKIGKKFSAEHRANIGAAKIGTRATAETRAKMSAAKAGKKHSAEHRAKNSAANTGRKLSDEHRANLSAAMIGNKGALGYKNSLGYKHTAEARAKISAARRKKKNILQSVLGLEVVDSER